MALEPIGSHLLTYFIYPVYQQKQLKSIKNHLRLVVQITYLRKVAFSKIILRINSLSPSVCSSSKSIFLGVFGFPATERRTAKELSLAILIRTFLGVLRFSPT